MTGPQILIAAVLVERSGEDIYRLVKSNPPVVKALAVAALSVVSNVAIALVLHLGRFW
jgi:hypothetical protein